VIAHADETSDAVGYLAEPHLASLPRARLVRREGCRADVRAYIAVENELSSRETFPRVCV
jgi:hypothetical protein